MKCDLCLREFPRATRVRSVEGYTYAIAGRPMACVGTIGCRKRREKLARDRPAELIAGRTILGASCDDECLTIELDLGLVIHVEVDTLAVPWSVEVLIPDAVSKETHGQPEAR